jgi:hypothetical protein
MQRIKNFHGTRDHAIKIWIARGVYVLVAIVNQKLDLP